MDSMKTTGVTAMAKVLISCETSGIVREAFLARGHDAWSCDLLPADTPSNRHIVGDVRDVMMGAWDLMAVMHPPCTRLTNSGVRWLSVPPPGRGLCAARADGAAVAVRHRPGRPGQRAQAHLFLAQGPAGAHAHRDTGRHHGAGQRAQGQPRPGQVETALALFPRPRGGNGTPVGRSCRTRL